MLNFRAFVCFKLPKFLHRTFSSFKEQRPKFFLCFAPCLHAELLQCVSDLQPTAAPTYSAWCKSEKNILADVL